MSLESAITLFIITCTTVVIPGPAMFSVIRAAIFGGVKDSIILLTGITTIDSFWITFVYFSGSAIQHSDLIMIGISLFGATYIGKMSYDIWHLDSFDKKALNKKQEVFSYKRGFLINASNPKAILFYTSIIIPLMNDSIMLYELAGVILSGIYITMGVFIYLATKLKSKLLTPTTTKKINRYSSLIFALVSIFLLLNAYDIYTDMGMAEVSTLEEVTSN